MKRFTLLTFLLFAYFGAFAQTITVKSFQPLPMDMTASSLNGKRIDQNGQVAALIKIVTTETGFTFEGGTLGIVDSKQENGEVWVWVPRASRKITIKHQQLGVLRDYRYPVEIESERTYEMVLTTGKVETIVKQEVTQQYLAFQISPTNAVLEVEGELWEVASDGSAMKFVNFGTYNYRVQAPNYHIEFGKVTVNDPEKTQKVTVTLKPDFVEVTLKVDADAEIWVNNEKKGTRTWTGNLGKGNYKIECKQASHETSMITKEITADMNGQTIDLPKPTPIYGSLNIESTPGFATVYIDGKKVGETPKSVNEILIGEHEVKLTKDGYADYTETITINKGERKQVKATLNNGKEIQFTCNVSNAQLEIDGQRVGSANDTYMLTYGSHSLKVTASNYCDYTYTINVGENSIRSHSIQMQSLTKDEKIFKVKGVSFTMKFVEGGTFQMGATSEQGSDAYDNEKPVHSVTLSNYYMGETEVTQALWQALMGSNPSQFEGDNLPVNQVTWNDCQEFIRKLNQKTGKNFRLPTEAEWEYAARGGKKSRGYKYSGSNTLRDVAWFGQWNGYTYDNGNSGEKTHAVKTKSPNELGLYDMSGNVWEWCSDWYGSYGSSTQTNPTGSSSGSSRVLRGGGWLSRAGNCRVSFRRSNDNYVSGFYYCGFRLCLSE